MHLLGLLMPVLAAAGWLYFIHQSDRYEKEPWPLVLRTAAAGAGAGIIGLGLELFISTFVLGSAFTTGSATGDALAVAAVMAPAGLLGIALAMTLVAFHNPNWNEPFDGLVYGGAAGIGYGLTYTIIALAQGLQLGFRLAVFSIPLYMLVGILLGHHASQAKFGRRRLAWWSWVRGLAVAGVVLWATQGALELGAQVVAGENMLAAALAYLSNMLAWIIALRAIHEGNDESHLNPDRGHLRLERAGCPHCGAGFPVGARYCIACGQPVGKTREASLS